MKLYFQNSRDEERLLAECETVKEVNLAMKKFLKDHNYKSYYRRIWGTDESVIVDVGSYFEFFVIKGISHSEYVEKSKKEAE